MLHRGMPEKAIRWWGRVTHYLAATTRLGRMVALHTGDRLFKWEHYYEIYDRHFDRFRGREITLLEIGVSNGGSLALWRKYFGPKARLIGVDIEPDCLQYAKPGTVICIGSQDDPAFLRRVAAEHGPFDIVIDDGSHAYEHQRLSFETLFEHIKDDGLYVCEDVCTSYWTEVFGGGPKEAGTFIEYLKNEIDELNAWFWREDREIGPDSHTRTMHAIQFYAALAIIEKRRVKPPIIAHVGSRYRRRGRRAPAKS